jgi:hypothetical protein
MERAHRGKRHIGDESLRGRVEVGSKRDLPTAIGLLRSRQRTGRQSDHTRTRSCVAAESGVKSADVDADLHAAVGADAGS